MLIDAKIYNVTHIHVEKPFMFVYPYSKSLKSDENKLQFIILVKYIMCVPSYSKGVIIIIIGYYVLFILL